MSHESQREKAPGFEITGPRYSFADRATLRSDEIRHRDALQYRVIEYPASETHRDVADLMVDAGLVIGNRSESDISGNNAFILPRATRPIRHDAASMSSSPFTYDDRALFGDLGWLLKQVEGARSEESLIVSDVGDNVAVMKFTKVDDRRLFLVPGFENFLRVAKDSNDALNTYCKELSGDFDERFDRNVGQFISGYQVE